MRNPLSVTLLILTSSISCAVASEFMNQQELNCYGNEAIEVCQNFIDLTDSHSLTDRDELYLYARAFEHAHHASGFPTRSVQILKQLAAQHPDNEEYLLTLSHYHDNYSETVGDDRWYIALSYALQVVREFPESKYSHERVSALLLELHQTSSLLDSALVFSVQGFEKLAGSDACFINKLASGSRVYQALIDSEKLAAAESFRRMALKRLEVSDWKQALIEQSEAMEPRTAADVIRQLCNGSLVQLDRGDGCHDIISIVLATNPAYDDIDDTFIQAIQFANSNAGRYAPENVKLATVIETLSARFD